MSWTDDRVEKLKQLWSEGLSASQIATQLGGVTRNAVIGKVHRLALPGRVKNGGATAAEQTRATSKNTTAPRAPNFTARAATQSPVSTPVAPVTTMSPPRLSGANALKQEAVAEIDTEEAPAPQAQAGNVVVPIMRKIALIELTEQTCKWPVGDPTTTDFYFCGCEAPENTPYCDYHSKMAYQPVSERRRAS